jgi:hypothetical protein
MKAHPVFVPSRKLWVLECAVIPSDIIVTAGLAGQQAEHLIRADILAHATQARSPIFGTEITLYFARRAHQLSRLLTYIYV